MSLTSIPRINSTTVLGLPGLINTQPTTEVMLNHPKEAPKDLSRPLDPDDPHLYLFWQILSAYNE